MLGGYTGKFLWVNLSNGEIHTETPPEDLYRDFIGGYGVGAKVLYDRLEPGVDPLGPENILGFLTGPLTGSSAPSGTRWTVVTKSPLTGGWGDANGSGFFGVAMKKAGYDGVFFTGAAEKPVYLHINEGEAELRDAADLWGKDTYEIDDWVKAELGKNFEAACIGPSGEKLSLISGIVHSKGRTAARSGVGAVMGAKKLKMVAVAGTMPFPTADQAEEKVTRKKYMKEISDGVGSSNFYRETGTPGILTWTLYMGDTPVNNWGESVTTFPDPSQLEFSELVKYRDKRRACYRCPLACWGTSTLEYDGEPFEAHQPEYQTSSAFGCLTGNNNYPSLIKANDLCNRYGLDTISAGSCMAFAIECYQNGLIDVEDTGGIELNWGDHKAMIAMLHKLALREDIGDVLALGVKRAAEHIGPEAVEYAVHVGGQELPMHDPRFEPGLAVVYKMDPTPGRHTQASQYTVPPGFESDRPAYGENRENQEGRGTWMKEASNLTHTMNASGMCLFGFASTNVTFIPEYLSVVRGEPFDVNDMLVAGERIANIREAFNVREGINPVTQPYPARGYSKALTEGPTKNVTIDIDQMVEEYLDAMGWTQDAAVPTQETLERLGMPDVAKDLWERIG